MVQATTPTFILTLPNTVDLTLIEHMYFSLEQGATELLKTDDDLFVDGQAVSVYLTQAESAAFNTGKALLQLNWTYSDGSRACSNIVNVDVGLNLIKEVIE